ncbi:alpha/beta-hydrolase [Hesseltinella vesiculosa]|uniref:Alpha/beta-hydrolase n=1 Tax=Hesseltinella vesiculosa TaxID=101127 RepID=A0A1X2GV96_9FUNG|nr:alpha/beta-hydrolase [Hesseltinella vesiculosa]
MAVTLKSFSFLVIFVSLAWHYSQMKRVVLPSLYVDPSPIYTPDFFDGGHDVQLPLGQMRYWEFGPANGNKVVLIHGIATGASSFDIVARSLAENNHRVLIFDLWGRGYSEAPDTYYDDALYVTQVALLLQKVGWAKADVIGLSLGGGIAASFTATYPEMVGRLALLAPAGLMNEQDLPLTGRLVRFPGVRSLLTHPSFRPLAIQGLSSFMKKARQQTTASDKYVAIVKHQFTHHPGFIRAFLSTVIDFPFSELHGKFKMIGQNNDIPVLAVWGDKDTTVPFDNMQTLKQLVPQLQTSVYPGGGHDIVITQGAQVSKDIVAFLK